MIQNYQPSRIRFEQFELDIRTGELRKNGERVRLQDQPTKLLALLATHPGQLITRVDIQRALWADDEFVEFEHAINTAIKKVREALEDDPAKPRLIETLPRKGYRFLAKVEEVEDAQQPDAPEWPQMLAAEMPSNAASEVGSPGTELEFAL